MFKAIIGGFIGAIAFGNVALATCTAPSNGTTADATVLNTYLTCEFAPLASPSFAGDVGIGTASPTHVLEVAPATSDSLLGNVLLGAWPNSASYAMFGNRTALGVSAYDFALLQDTSGLTYLNSGNGEPMIFRIFNANSSGMYLSSAGLLSLGSEIAGSFGVTIGNNTGKMLALNDTSSTGSPYLEWDQAGTRQAYAQWLNGSGLAIGTFSGANIGLWINGTEDFILNSGGDVGIGTTTPAQTLTVSGSTSSAYGHTVQFVAPGGTNQVNITSTLNAWGLLAGSDPSSQTNSGYHGPSNSYLINVPNAPLVLGANNLAIEYISSSGSYTNGTITASSDIYATGSFGFQSATTVGATSPCYTSSSGYYVIGLCTSLSQYKSNQRPLSLGLDTLMKLHPVEFDWDKQHGGHHDLGFIAQEVEKVNPLLAEYDYKDDPKGKLISVKYTQMTALITKAVQELKTANDAQNAQNSTTQKVIGDEVKTLQAQNEHLKTIVEKQQAQIGVLQRASATRASSNDQSRKFMRLGAVNASSRSP